MSKALPAYRAKGSQAAERVVVKLPPDLLVEVDEWGVPAGCSSRTDAVRTLLKKGLEAVRSENAALPA